MFLIFEKQEIEIRVFSKYIQDTKYNFENSLMYNSKTFAHINLNKHNIYYGNSFNLIRGFTKMYISEIRNLLKNQFTSGFHQVEVHNNEQFNEIIGQNNRLKKKKKNGESGSDKALESREGKNSLRGCQLHRKFQN